MKAVTSFWDWVDTRTVVRRVVLGVTVWMVWRSFAWAAEYAVSSPRDGADIAMVIASVTSPIAVLQGYVFKLYAEGRNNA